MRFVVVVFPLLCSLQLLSQFLEVSLALFPFPFFWRVIRVISVLVWQSKPHLLCQHPQTLFLSHSSH